ncbi:nitrite reductase [Pontibacter sp. G13]|uniref:nitrite reductase n=1 Tax=Pontibacter sp. G13 TaxID=3074898 RepID=UPI00288AE34A|nr:nitrite reductase [Pontibacter sp. G13]WNJ21510.1 nitrite reductase [Pontibacter sp. G13]
MQSFRTEIENPIVQRDIIELERKIREFKEGKLDEEKFRSLRLARGVYGQRQPGVQMIRIKLPYGKMTVRQLRRISDVADEYSNGNLHATTRQDIQIHYVSLDRTPELWAELEKDEVTLREACGNTVRNVTASPLAGIDAEEPFDVTPYAHAFFAYFLRNPVCQEMGRKFKVSFSSSPRDTAFSFMHDLGFIPKVRVENGQEVRGFKVLLGGGLGAQPALAHVVHEFLPTDELIPFSESVIRIFDRHGERSKRFKARMKFLVKKIGVDELLRLATEERKALPHQTYPIDAESVDAPQLPEFQKAPNVVIEDQQAFELWMSTNVKPQKQPGYFAIQIPLQLGNIDTQRARQLADLVEGFAGDDIRVTPTQGLILRYAVEEHLPYLFQELSKLGLADPGFGSIADITACPGTDTCNLAISSSTGISVALEQVIRSEYPELLHNLDLSIKISGCMNACGQHSIAAIGFHGSTIKSGDAVAPALQILLGGGVLGDGEAAVAQKVIKIPTKRGPAALRVILDDYEANALEGEYYAHYFERQGKAYFYTLLKELGNSKNLTQDDYLDWGHEIAFEPAIGVGECAGVVIDLVATLLFETQEKIDLAHEALQYGSFSDAIYHAYSAFVNGAKAILIREGLENNTHAGIISGFQEHIVATGKLKLASAFPTLVYAIKENEPSESFAQAYLASSEAFLKQLVELHQTPKSHA